MNAQEQKVPIAKPEVATEDLEQAQPAQLVQPSQQVENPQGVRTIALVIAVVLLSAIAYVPHVRSTREQRATHATEDAAVLSVNVVQPTAGSQGGDLTLPGNVVAFTDTPIAHQWLSQEVVLRHRFPRPQGSVACRGRNT